MESTHTYATLQPVRYIGSLVEYYGLPGVAIESEIHGKLNVFLDCGVRLQSVRFSSVEPIQVTTQ